MTKLKFSFNNYSRALSSQLLQEHESSFVLAITGVWGCGKTTLMNSVVDSLSDGKFIKVTFNAWRYTQEDALWRAFFAAIIQQLREHISNNRVIVRNNWSESDIAICNELLEETERSLYSAFTQDVPGEITIDTANLAKTGAKLALKFVPWGNFGSELIDKLFIPKDDEGNPKSQVFEAGDIDQLWGVLKRSTIKRQVDKLTSIEQFHESIKRLIHAVLHGDYETPAGKLLTEIPLDRRFKIVVAIDDLDRCLPEQSLEILESIKLFLDTKDTYFILAMDQDMIQNALDLRYKNSEVKRPQLLAKQYTEKMINLTFAIPTINKERFLDFISSDLANGVQLAELHNLFSIAIPNNIRAWKRFATRAKLNQEIIMSLQNNEGIKAKDIPLFLKFQCFAYRWPEIFSRIHSIDTYKAFEQCMNEVQLNQIPSDTPADDLASRIKADSQSHSQVPESIWERVKERALCQFVATAPLLADCSDIEVAELWFSLDRNSQVAA